GVCTLNSCVPPKALLHQAKEIPRFLLRLKSHSFFIFFLQFLQVPHFQFYGAKWVIEWAA
ncbi:hypothetical protein CIB84_015131, partial [Bambusicola thoracicus]